MKSHFRKEFSNLGEIRSIIPENVLVITLDSYGSTLHYEVPQYGITRYYLHPTHQ